MALELSKEKAASNLNLDFLLLRKRTRIIAIFSLFIVLLFAIFLTLQIGSSSITTLTIAQILLDKIPLINIDQFWPASVETIVLNIRLPRIILAGLVGAALAVAGATYQGLFRNPLADPYLIGVAQGAGLGAILGFLLPTVWQNFSIPLLAFVGAVLTVSVVYLVAKIGKTLPVTTLILAGVAIGAFLIAITSYLMIISHDKLSAIIAWILGTFSLSSWQQIIIVLPYMIIGITIIFLYARPLNIMQLDEEQAQQLGINVERTKLILLGAATLITASAVCFCGTIGFVGIIVPHAMRILWGPDHRFLLPLSTVAGAILLILADTAARTMLSPTEIPVGIITALVGAPFFLILLRRTRRQIF